MSIDPSAATDLYAASVDEELRWSECYQTRISFFVGMLSALFGATVAGAWQAEIPYHYFMLCAGPVLAFLVAGVAIKATSRLYYRFLDAVSMRAKLEQLIGMTESPVSRAAEQSGPWMNEALTPARHIDSRSSYRTSSEWFEASRDSGTHLWTRRLFRGSQVLAVALLLVTLWMSAQSLGDARRGEQSRSSEVLRPCAEQSVSGAEQAN